MAVHQRTASSSDWISEQLRQHGFWEARRPEDLLRRAPNATTLAPAGGTMLDVGANIGFLSLLMAHRGDSVIAVEPMARNREAIDATLCLNPDLRARVRVEAMAAGSAEGANDTSCVLRAQREINLGDGVLECGPRFTCASQAPPSMSVLRRNLRAADALTLERWRRLPCEPAVVGTLDALLTRLAPSAVTFAKFDLEGHECEAFRGAQALFRAWRPLHVLTEWKDRAVAVCARAEAQRHGYAVAAPFGPDRNVLLSRRADSRSDT